MKDGKTYEVETNFMQGFSEEDLDGMWREVRQGNTDYFTTSKTITGRDVITSYRKAPEITKMPTPLFKFFE